MTNEPTAANSEEPPPTAPISESPGEAVTAAAKAAEAEKGRDEYFAQYWHYATNLRNWFIAYGVACILLLTRADAVFNTQPQASLIEPGLKLLAIALFLFGLATQVALTLVNKVGHYYAYQKFVVEPERRRHRFATWVCHCYWIDLVFDIATLGFYVSGTVVMARLF